MNQPAPGGKTPPTLDLFFTTANAYQRSAALKAAIELELFTAIGEGNGTPVELAQRCKAAERGVRILADYLVVIGFLTKQGGRYGLTPDAAMFLDRRSPAYTGGAIEFLNSPQIMDSFRDLAAVVRQGGTIRPAGGNLAPEHPVWVEFARAMAPMMAMPAEMAARLVLSGGGNVTRVLDIAASHGLYGLAFARQASGAEVVALDWPNVLQVARENAERTGVSGRFRTIPGSAFDVDFAGPYDVILLPNFLHHFDPPTCEGLLRKVRAALAPGGRAVTLEFVPNEDRVSPPHAATFALTMLGTTPSGDAYTYRELESMFRNAGFSRSELHELPPSPSRVVISHP